MAKKQQLNAFFSGDEVVGGGAENLQIERGKWAYRKQFVLIIFSMGWYFVKVIAMLCDERQERGFVDLDPESHTQCFHNISAPVLLLIENLFEISPAFIAWCLVLDEEIFFLIDKIIFSNSSTGTSWKFLHHIAHGGVIRVVRVIEMEICIFTNDDNQIQTLKDAAVLRCSMFFCWKFNDAFSFP